MALNSSLTALTREKFMPILVDNIFNSSVLCYKLLKNADMLDGGTKIVVPIEYAENNSANGGWLLHPVVEKEILRIRGLVRVQHKLAVSSTDLYAPPRAVWILPEVSKARVISIKIKENPKRSPYFDQKVF